MCVCFGASLHSSVGRRSVFSEEKERPSLKWGQANCISKTSIKRGRLENQVADRRVQAAYQLSSVRLAAVSMEHSSGLFGAHAAGMLLSCHSAWLSGRLTGRHSPADTLSPDTLLTLQQQQQQQQQQQPPLNQRQQPVARLSPLRRPLWAPRLLVAWPIGAAHFRCRLLSRRVVNLCARPLVAGCSSDSEQWTASWRPKCSKWRTRRH